MKGETPTWLAGSGPVLSEMRSPTSEPLLEENKPLKEPLSSRQGNENSSVLWLNRGSHAHWLVKEHRPGTPECVVLSLLKRKSLKCVCLGNQNMNHPRIKGSTAIMPRFFPVDWFLLLPHLALKGRSRGLGSLPFRESPHFFKRS